ncbi:MAG: hypothetical protein EYC68_22310 [Chloroflexota bacterium]|nr:MAG: hypothetical protein EYC68_22310 [Chloroflexota bacterium]
MLQQTKISLAVKRFAATVVILASAAGVLGCGANGAAGGAQIAMKDYQFAPQTIHARVGETARFVVKNNDAVAHTFTVKELGVNQNIPARGQAVIEFQTPTQGIFAYVCLPHPNMRGTIEVEP